MSDLRRLFRTTEEEISPVEATVSGDWPDWLEGNLVRVGPGIFELTSGFTFNHWCDGYSVLHKFSIQKGKVKFTKRYLTSEAYEKAEKVGKPAMAEFGTRAYTDTTKGFFARAISQLLPDVTDNCSGNIIKVGNSYFATTDTANLRVIYPDDLSTGEKIDLFKMLGVHICCCHMLRDHNGDTYVLATSLVTGLKYNVIRIPDSNGSTVDAFKDAKVICTISSRWKTCVSYYHSFGLTENYIIFVEQPYIMNGMKLLTSHIKGKSMKDCLEWTPEEVNRFYVIEKATGKVLPTKYRSKQPFFMFHTINAYEENGEIIVDVIGHDSPDIVDKMFIENLRQSTLNAVHKPEARRYVLPIVENIKSVNEGVNLLKTTDKSESVRNGDAIEMTYQLLCAPAHEMPNFNRKLLGKKHRYFYATGLYEVSQYSYTIVKVDLQDGSVKTWFAGEGQVPSEPLFIERPDAKSEDDGILLVEVTTSQEGDTDRLVVLDALTLQQIAMASLPCHLPLGLHGIFIQDQI